MRPARVYCDYNATAPLRPEAKAAMSAALELTGNPSSVHTEGRKARGLVEAARETVAAAIGACRDDIAFVSGGTEAVSLALRGAIKAIGRDVSLIASDIEHDSVVSITERFAPENQPSLEERSGMTWTVDGDGRVDLETLDAVAYRATCFRRLRPLASLMLVNNETGVIQPVAEAAKTIRRYDGGLIHCDAIQALGKIEVNVTDLDVDYLSLSSHKIGGPQGVGAVYVKAGAPFAATLTGGGQEFGRRAGTESVAGIAGFAAAVEAAVRDMPKHQALAAIRDGMEAKLKVAAPTLQVHGAGVPRVAGVSCFGVEGLPSETQVMGMDLAGVALSAGAACSSGKVRPSRVLTAMGLPDTAARSAIRVSFGWATKLEDFEVLANAWISMAGRARPNLVKLDANV